MLIESRSTINIQFGVQKPLTCCQLRNTTDTVQ
jgi:hypothetical protein